jgi:peptide deformylase
MEKMLKIYTVDNPNEEKFLRETTQNLDISEIKSSKFQKFVDEMIYTAQNYESGDGYLSVGLAAIQVGKKYNMFLFYRPEYEEFEVMINPQMDILTPLQDVEKEGCLSIPGFEGKVARYKKIKVKYLDRDGEKKKGIFTDMEAREIQHEYDHTKGVLFTDKLVD